MPKLPKAYSEFLKMYPEVARAYQELGEAAAEAGPLDTKSRELVRLAIAVGSGWEGAVHSHTRRAWEAGATAEEIRQVVLLSVTTIGFPAMRAALSWVDDILES